MPDKKVTPTRKPFGECDEQDKLAPLGSRTVRSHSTASSETGRIQPPQPEPGSSTFLATPARRPDTDSSSRDSATPEQPWTVQVFVERVSLRSRQPSKALLRNLYSRPKIALLAILLMLVALVAIWAGDRLADRHVQASAETSLIPANSPRPQLVRPLPQATEVKRVGIQSGHRGINPETGLGDPGAVCADGLTEQKTVEKIAFQARKLLEKQGYTVDILNKWDARLDGYSALALVAIHADSCDYINDEATGFKVASYSESQNPNEDNKLVGCLVKRYQAVTGLPLHPGITSAMTDYYAFRQIAPIVPAAIIEVGFLYLDRTFLVEHSDSVAQGIAEGIQCYLLERSDAGRRP